MQKATTMLAVVGGFIVAGMILSFYGSMIIIDDFAQGTENIGGGDEIRIDAELNPGVNTEGIFAVQTMEFQENTISVAVIDPSGTKIASQRVNTESFEERFEIETAGMFTLVIENSGEPTDVAGAIGHVPDAAKLSVGVTGLYLLAAGLVGMAVVGIYVVKNRKR